MSKQDAKYFRMRIGTTLLGATTSMEMNVEKDYQKTTNQDSGGFQEIHPTAGVRRVSGSFENFYDPDGVLNAEEIVDMILNNSGLVIIDCGMVATGGIFYRFSGVISNVGFSAKNDGVVTCKGSFESSGAITKTISTGSAGS